jgi:hypothetical protein
MLDWTLDRQMEAGYIPDTCFVMHDVDGKQKEQAICFDSKKLSIGYGLIRMHPGTLSTSSRACGHPSLQSVSWRELSSICLCQLGLLTDLWKIDHSQDFYHEETPLLNFCNPIAFILMRTI